jgi:hypothetical protein
VWLSALMRECEPVPPEYLTVFYSETLRRMAAEKGKDTNGDISRN